MEVQDNQSLSACYYQEPEPFRSIEQQPLRRQGNPLSADMDEDNGMTMNDAKENLESPEHEIVGTGRNRQLKKRGRPRLDSPGAAVLSSNRRVQIRQAQKTYRLKKEATLESGKTRMIGLERRMKKLAESFAECYDSAVRSDLHVTHPALYTHLRGMRAHLAPEIEELSRTSTMTHESPIISIDPDESGPQECGKGNESHNTQPATSFGYQIPNQSSINGFDGTSAAQDTQRQTSPVESHLYLGPVSKGCLERSHFPGLWYLEGPLRGSIPITYSFHETTFSRRLHRYSLEYAYHLFIDSHSDPTVTYRIFRLVPCIRDKPKMLPYFRKLVCAGVEDALEIPSLPFYCIGGAGTHYPHKDHCGHLTYPSNTRLPQRILGILPGPKTSHETGSLDPQSHLKLFGFDGEWFDCQDVQGYLEENGVILDQSSLFAEVHMPVFYQSTGVGVDSLLDKRQMSIRGPRATNNDRINSGFGSYGDEVVAVDNSQIETNKMASSPSPLQLDVECFLASKSSHKQWLLGLIVAASINGYKCFYAGLPF
ncbi:hypothetical protein EG329_008613 [Mollisiaceae sp. DMI_Dod_QoI]|nr:hypothetical protein EG329_008613 [Helotiales sp. DMI_Dod_QoI]